jgi:hypothetical protein
MSDMGRVAYRGGTPDDCPPSVARRESTAKVGELFAIRNERLCMTAFGMVIYGANGRDGGALQPFVVAMPNVRL